MITISLCMIVKDEEKVLKRCLDSAVSFADEIIIVDTGSSDSTKKIAETYTKKVYDFTWNDDFSAARNEAFRHAEMDYCMWLDADDIVSEPEQKKIQRLILDSIKIEDQAAHKQAEIFPSVGTNIKKE